VKARRTQIQGVASRSIGIRAVVAGIVSASRTAQPDDARQCEPARASRDGGIGDQIQKAFTLAIGAPDDAGVTENPATGARRCIGDCSTAADRSTTASRSAASGRSASVTGATVTGRCIGAAST
jgi:hypothetical protein